MSQTLIQQLQAENARLLERVSQLERENLRLLQEETINLSALEQQAQCLISSRVFVHGPDTLEGFERFSLTTILSEIKSLAFPFQ